MHTHCDFRNISPTFYLQSLTAREQSRQKISCAILQTHLTKAYTIINRSFVSSHTHAHQSPMNCFFSSYQKLVSPHAQVFSTINRAIIHPDKVINVRPAPTTTPPLLAGNSPIVSVCCEWKYLVMPRTRNIIPRTVNVIPIALPTTSFSEWSCFEGFRRKSCVTASWKNVEALDATFQL